MAMKGLLLQLPGMEIWLSELARTEVMIILIVSFIFFTFVAIVLRSFVDVNA